ncbi:MAG: cyclic nucleotide-binding domain-containing protein [Desulfobacteraceae bacterium]|nr:MAG: cyclic nucleotide-binding domain-containing protein [Desulfobacteraceae bacterium]
MISLKDLDKVQAFKELSDEQLAAIQQFCVKQEFKRGERLFKEGDAADYLWLVVDGQVDLRFELPGNRPSTDETTISSFEADEQKKRILGWSCFIPPYKMMLSAYCVTRTCSVIQISRQSLLDLFDQDPLMGYRVMSYLIKVLGYRFQQFQNELAKCKGHGILNSW